MVRLLYLLRILRIIKIFRYMQSLRAMLDNLKSCLRPFSGMLLLLVIFMFIFAVLGVQQFGGRLKGRSNFNGLFNAMVTVFQICTGEDWNAIMYEAVEARPAQGPRAPFASRPMPRALLTPLAHPGPL